MSIKIGNRDVVFTANLIIPQDEDCWLEFNVEDWAIKTNIVFQTLEDDKESRKVTVEGVDDYGKITFINWTNSLGTATLKPMRLAKTNSGKTVSFMACHEVIGTVNFLNIQFLLGGDE